MAKLVDEVLKANKRYVAKFGTLVPSMNGR